MRCLWFIALLVSSLPLYAQDSLPSAPQSQKAPDSAPAAASKPANEPPHKFVPPRSDSINANQLSDAPGESSSKDTQIDLSPPSDDAKTHPNSRDILLDEGSGASDGSQVHPWDPHRAAKDVEVGDFYFKRKNYRAAEDRYSEALYYKENDAIATYRLAVCLEKLDRPTEALAEFEEYLKILPEGPDAKDAQKAIERLNARKAADGLVKTSNGAKTP